MSFDLTGYLGRIEFPGALRADRATLEALHLAHATRIPFELSRDHAFFSTSGLMTLIGLPAA